MTPADHSTTRPLDRWIEDHFWLPVLVVFIGGLLARVLLALPTMMNPDEAMHTLRSCLPTLWDVYKADLEGPDPSLLHVLIFPLCKLLASDFVLRLPSVLAGALAVFFMYKWLKELFDRTTGLIGMTLMAFAPAVVYFSAEIRAYSILVFFSVFALYCLEAGVRRQSPTLLLLFGLGQCLALVSQYSALFLLFAAGTYSLYLALRGRIRGRSLAAWIAAEAATVGLLVFQYATHLSRLHGSQIETQMKGSFLSRAYFDPAKDTVLSFVVSRTVAAFGFLFTSRYVGYVAFALFLAGVLLILVRGITGDGVRGRREVAWLLVAPWLMAAAGGVLALYPFAGMRHASLLVVFAVAGIAFLLGQVTGRRPALILLAAILLVPVWNITRINYAAGWPIDPRESRRSQIMQAVEHVREMMPDGGIVFSDLESHHVFTRYLFNGHTGTGRSAPPAFYEYEWNGLRMVTLKRWKVKPDSLGDEFHRMAESYGLEPGTQVAVVSCGWGLSLAQNMERQGISYAGTREFSKNIAVLSVPVGSEVLSDSMSRQVGHTRQALHNLAYRLSQAIRQRAEMVVWPSSYFDSTAIELAGKLGQQVRSYRMLYGLQAPFEELIPTLTFWVFGTQERHAPFMAHMNEGGNYLYADLKFTLLATDPDTLVAVYLVE